MAAIHPDTKARKQRVPDTLIKPSQAVPLKRRKPALLKDRGGNGGNPQLVTVPLPGGKAAQIELADFNALMGKGYSDQWWLHSNGRDSAYVRTTRAGDACKMVTVARLIIGGCDGTHIRYVDGNPLNLRRSNLKVKAPTATA